MTYSIVARDAETGEMGVAVQSAWFSVGNGVGWVNAGVGVVATQAWMDPSYGPRGLTLMRNGLSPERTLAALLEIDENSEHRQVAMVDSQGRVASHTGSRNPRHAAHVVRGQASCQGNILASPDCVEAMMTAYEEHDGDLGARLFAALRAADHTGGDARGRQSASLTVVAGTGRRDLFQDRVFDIRIDDHADPLGELERVMTVQRAYHALNIATDLLMEDDRRADALAIQRRAYDVLPDDGNVAFWTFATLVASGDEDGAAKVVHRHREHGGVDWHELIQRFHEKDALPFDDGAVRTMLRLVAPTG